MVKINIAIIGYGRMGKIIEKLAKEKGLTVKSIIDPFVPDANYQDITEESLKDVDVCIEFSVPEVVIDNVRKVALLKKNMVLGTTGWYEKLEEVKNIVENAEIGFIYAPNFSIGVNIFFRIVKDTAKIINKFEEYDIYGYELHHNQKKDSPSGTAKKLAEILITNIKRKHAPIFDKLDRVIKPEEIHFASIRGGFIPGTHVIGFDSEFDTIELRHIARTRMGFALGALIAANWIKNKIGFYSIDDMLKDLLG